MAIRVKKLHPALKHAGYSALSVLPGESAAEFEKLHRNLIAEYTPNGVSQNDIVATMARVLGASEIFQRFELRSLLDAVTPK